MVRKGHIKLSILKKMTRLPNVSLHKSQSDFKGLLTVDLQAHKQCLNAHAEDLVQG